MSVISDSVGKRGANRIPDIRAVQCLLNLTSSMLQSGLREKLRMNGLLESSPRPRVPLNGSSAVKDVITTKKADGTKEKGPTGYMMSQVDETAWCACFVNWCLAQAGKTPQKGAGAQTYSRYGRAC
jgi:hypothetical protein